MRSAFPLGGPSSLLLISAAFAAAPEKPKVALPKDPSVVALTLDYRGGFTPPPKNKDPYLTITAGGKVIANNPSTNKKVEGLIKPDEVLELVKFAVEQDFFGFDENAVKALVKAEQDRTGNRVEIADVGSTILMVRTADKEHTAKYYGLSFFARQFKEVKPLGQLAAVETRLRRVMHETYAGGKDGLKAALDQANAELKKQQPELKPLTAAELVYAQPQGEATHIVFTRFLDKPGTFVTATVERPDKGAAKVTIVAQFNPE